MSNNIPLRDAFGNIDDFDVLPGKVSNPLVRKLFLDSNLPQEFKNYLRLLFTNGYSKSEVCSVLIHALNVTYGEGSMIDLDGESGVSVGGLVKARPEYVHLRSDSNTPGIVTSHVIKIEHSYEVSFPNELPSTWQGHMLEEIDE